ncbi:MAG: tryptophan--tRNA ligase [Actinomycetota bacterium]
MARGRINLNVNLIESSRRRVFSGVQPTGEPHLGNYIGAFRRWVALQDEFDSFFCIVDLHAMTMPWDPERLNDQSRLTGAVLLACGIDPDKAVLFRQSQVAQHTELAWILTCVARMGELRRMVQFKEKSRGETESVGAGILTYPVLQAADVLLYQAHGVPVGEDQRQHIELMRDLGTRFNKTLGRTFVIPEPWIAEEGAKILALDDPGEKMSKSSTRPGSFISVSDPPEVVAKKIRSAVTDSGREVAVGEDKPALTNLLTIYSILEGTPVQELVERFAGAGYAPFKQGLAECVVEHLRPIRDRYLELEDDPAELDRLLGHGAKRAADVAEATMVEVRRRAGLGPRP